VERLSYPLLALIHYQVRRAVRFCFDFGVGSHFVLVSVSVVDCTTGFWFDFVSVSVLTLVLGMFFLGFGFRLGISFRFRFRFALLCLRVALTFRASASWPSLCCRWKGSRAWCTAATTAA
jgi:hypothetical protein